MLKIGITGGIGSGKTSVSEILRNLGYRVLDADKIGHFCLKSTYVKEMLKEAFGDGIFRSGEIDRKKLGGIVFSSEKELKKLNGIMIPEMVSEIRKEFALLESKSEKTVFIEAAILFEMGLDKFLDAVLLVVADESTRIMRLRSRDGKNEDDIKKIIRSQNEDYLKRKIDFEIENNGTLDELKTKCLEIIDRLHC